MINELSQIFDSFLMNFLLIVSGVFVTSWILKKTTVFFLKNYLKTLGWVPEGYSVSKHFYPAIGWMFFIVGIKLLLPALNISEKLYPIANKTCQLIMIVVSAYLLVRTINFIKLILFNSFDSSVEDNLKHRKIRTQLDFSERMAITFIIVITFSAILLSFEGAKKLGSSIIASAGLAGIIVGFAAQKTIANLIAGFQIAFTQPFRIDDVVIVQGEWGIIEEITLTYVVIKIWDKRRLVVPITYMIENPFQNWTRNTSDILGYAYIYADYSLPVNAVREEFLKILNSTPLWDKNVSVIQVTDLTEKTMQIRCLVSARNSADAFELRCHIREKLVEFIQQNYPESLPKHRLNNCCKNPIKNDPEELLI